MERAQGQACHWRTRLHLGRSTPALRAALPVANTNWYIAGPYPTANGAEAYGTAFGPEEDGPISFGKKFRDQTWRYSPGVIDGQTIAYTNDSLGRLIARAYPDGTLHTFAYNARGNLTNYTDATGIHPA